MGKLDSILVRSTVGDANFRAAQIARWVKAVLIDSEAFYQSLFDLRQHLLHLVLAEGAHRMALDVAE
jgi:hypothetical protein